MYLTYEKINVLFKDQNLVYYNLRPIYE